MLVKGAPSDNVTRSSDGQKLNIPAYMKTFTLPGIKQVNRENIFKISQECMVKNEGTGGKNESRKQQNIKSENWKGHIKQEHEICKAKKKHTNEKVIYNKQSAMKMNSLWYDSIFCIGDIAIKALVQWLR